MRALPQRHVAGARRPDRARVIPIGALLRVQQGHPVHADLQDPGGLRELQPARAALAGPDRRHRRRQGRRGRPLQGHATWRVVTMEITDNGRPVREDATLKIRPRLFLEGNFFVDLKPGTPGADELADGGMIPVTQTATPVQLDQVLTALQTDTRASLQETLIGFGEALDSEPTAADDADQDPTCRASPAARRSTRRSETASRALRDIGDRPTALLGTRTTTSRA